MPLWRSTSPVIQVSVRPAQSILLRSPGRPKRWVNARSIARTPAPCETMRVPSMSQRISFFTDETKWNRGASQKANQTLNHQPGEIIMKAVKLLLPLVAAAAAFSLIGCATPAARIKKNPDLFASYTGAQQDLIKQGKIAIGFDMD